MTIIFFIGIILAFIFLPAFRCVCLHPFSTLYYAVKDIYKYFRYRRYNEYRRFGTLTIFTGLFGKGKTLVLTYLVRRIYKKYNNKKVYDFNDKKWKIQHINVVSNVVMTDIPYIPLYSLNDMLDFAQDKWNDGVSVWLFVIDEMSTQINSREYKTNFTTELLNILLTCRHYRFQILGTAQRFNHVDALVRQVTQSTSECDKIWRLARVYQYDAWTVENTADLTKIKPKHKMCYFIKDKDYNAYDTRAVVENFKDNVKNGKILTDKEILEYQALQDESYNSSVNYKRKYRKKLH